MSFAGRLETLLSPLDVDTLWVAYSGGLDSRVLLQRLVHTPSLTERYTLHAIHIHHGLNPQADAWALHCQQTCDALGVQCQIIPVNVDRSPGKSIEASARKARYQVFADLLTSKGALLTAHHADDQAETLLLQLIRGASPKGLASMPAVSKLGAGYLIRPLLEETRQQLETVAKAEHLVWIDDDSNEDERFDRNFLRRRIMPLLRQRWPAVAHTLSRSARLCAQTNELVETLTIQDYQEIVGNKPSLLKHPPLAQRTPPRQRQVLRYWLGQLQLPLPDEVHLEQILHDVVNSQPDATPLFLWKGAEIRRWGDEIHARRVQPPPTLSNLPWSMTEPLILAYSKERLIAERQWEAGLKPPTPQQTVTVRFRQGGERFHPWGRQGSHPLKKLFQEWKIPPWERPHIPLIYYDESLVMVVGHAIAASHRAAIGEWGMLIRLSPNNL